jgi:hypothetical protein
LLNRPVTRRASPRDQIPEKSLDRAGVMQPSPSMFVASLKTANADHFRQKFILDYMMELIKPIVHSLKRI